MTKPPTLETARASKARAQPKAPRQRGMRAMGSLVSRVAGPVIRKRGLAEGRILTDWPRIVGDQIAACTCPEKLTPGKDGMDGTLVIRVAGGWATELQHLEPVFVEKINGYFGYRAVGHMRLRQGPLPADYTLSRRQLSTESQELDSSARAEIDATVAQVSDPEIRAALASLGNALSLKELKEKKKLE